MPPPIAVSIIVLPGQYGPELAAVGVGFALMVTVVVALAEHVPATTVSVHTPARFVFAVKEGF